MILTRATRYGDLTEMQHRSRIQTMLLAAGVDIVRDWTPRDTFVKAYVLRSCWVAECPRPACSGHADIVDPTWPFFVCTSCGLGVLRVEFPAESADIEALLNVRPRPTSRNWLVGETLDDLRRENFAHTDEIDWRIPAENGA